LGTIIAVGTGAGVASALFDKGLIFMKDKDILLTGEKWTLAVNIALDDYVNLIQGTRFILTQIQRNVDTHKSPNSKNLDIHWEEIRRLHKITDELETDLLSVSKLLSDEVPLGNCKGKIRRPPRGLINLFGYGLKYLFGTADDLFTYIG
jgi:hypothetical protein